MLRTRNKYCSNCLSTQRFLDLGACLVCERCSKRLERLETARELPHGSHTHDSTKVSARRIAAWSDHSEGLREAV